MAAGTIASSWPDWTAIEDMVRTGSTFAGNSEFNAFKKFLLKASVEEVDQQVDHAPVVWDFLIGFAAIKRWNTHQVFNKLSQVPSWTAAFGREKHLHAKIQTLHEDLKSVLQFLHDVELHEPSILEGSVCIDQNAAATMVKISDALSRSSSSVTLEPTDETALSFFSEDDGPEDDGPEDDGPEEVFYSLAELVDPKLWRCKPDVVERPHEREQFLAPDIFEMVFGMVKDDFAKLPMWKQSNLKKQHQLF